MKIHPVSDPPAGLTWADLTVDTVEILERTVGEPGGLVRVKLTLVGYVDKTTLVVEYDSLANLPAPGDAIRMSLWYLP
jgi:hypothetical protein